MYRVLGWYSLCGRKPMTQIYDVQRIRALLREGFTGDELRFFCQVTLEFQPLYAQLPQTIGEDELVERIVDHARAVSQFEKLLAWARKHNTAKYNVYQPYTIAGLSSATRQQLEVLTQQVQQPDGVPAPTISAIVPDSASQAVSGQSQVTIGDVKGGVRGTIIAGRDVERTSIGQVIVNAFRGPKKESLAQRNRQAMLKKVKGFWIKGVLEQSLYGEAMIELGLEEQSDVVDNPLNRVLRQAGQPGQALPPGTKIIQVFDQVGGALLILGEPGSGKTTMLLDLARDTIIRAERDPTQPIPVVFNLSSWPVTGKPIAEWLEDELKVKYQIPPKIGHTWIKDRELLLLLDGLDEVKLERREACVQAINVFSQEYGLKNIVVCSRVADYKALTTKLKLQGAMLLHPLTPEQVDTYLAQAGSEMAAVRTLLQKDEPLLELARSPLTLSVMVLAYRAKPVHELEGFASVAERRTHLFDTYVERMFRRTARTRREQYSREQSVGWLTWLAKQMIQGHQSVFLIENLQPTWLDARICQRLYVAICYFLIVGLVSLIGWLLTTGPISTLFGERYVTVMLFVLGFFALSGVLAIVGEGEYGEKLRKIEPVESLKWSLRNLGMSLGLAVLAGGVADSILSPFKALRQETGPFSRIPDVRHIGLQVGALVMLQGVLNWGVSPREIEVKSSPNQGIRRSAGHALVGGLVVGLLIGMIVWEWMDVFAERLRPSNLLLLRLGFIEGGIVAGAWKFGGLAVLQHTVLRVMLYLYGHIPWNYVRFLDHATERIFLRKVGGGYIFVHRLLQEYFASLYQG
jgi:hypothetical protein